MKIRKIIEIPEEQLINVLTIEEKKRLDKLFTSATLLISVLTVGFISFLFFNYTPGRAISGAFILMIALIFSSTFIKVITILQLKILRRLNKIEEGANNATKKS